MGKFRSNGLCTLIKSLLPTPIDQIVILFVNTSTALHQTTSLAASDQMPRIVHSWWSGIMKKFRSNGSVLKWMSCLVFPLFDLAILQKAWISLAGHSIFFDFYLEKTSLKLYSAYYYTVSLCTILCAICSLWRNAIILLSSTKMWGVCVCIGLIDR